MSSAGWHQCTTAVGHAPRVRRVATCKTRERNVVISRRVNSGWSLNPMSGAQVTKSAAVKTIQTRGVGVESSARGVGQASGCDFADAVLDPSMLAMPQLVPGQLPGDDTGAGVGDERGPPTQWWSSP